MAIPLPDLDDRGYADLLDEARALIPALAPEWTNHNPTDPGITLVELFAWLSEMVAWRTNQLPDGSVRAFLKLLNGPGWTGSGDLDGDVRATVLALREVHRAVTPADYEHLAAAAFNAWRADALQGEEEGAVPGEWYAVTRLSDTDAAGLPSRVPPVARARCVPRRNLSAGTEAGRGKDQPGHVSVLLLSPRAGDPGAEANARPSPLSRAEPPAAGETTRRAVRGFLEGRRLLGTRVHVVSPVYVPVRVEAVVVRRPDTPEPVPASTLAAKWGTVAPSDVRRAVLEALAGWLDPLQGGPGGGGWPFGRDVHLSELYALLEAVPGVDFVADLRLTSSCAGREPGCVAAGQAAHPRTGEPLGLALAAHHLPRAELAAADVHVAAAVLPVAVLVSAIPAPGVGAEALERAVGGAVRAALAPLGLGYGNAAGVDARAGEVHAAVRALAEVDPSAPVDVRFDADPARLLSDSLNQTLHLVAGEVAAPGVVLYTDGRELWS